MGGWPVWHIYCVVASIIALVILATVVLTLVHHGGYYDRSPWGSG